MSRLTDFEKVVGNGNGPEVHNTVISVIDGATHARSVLAPRMPNNVLIEGFSGSNGRRHMDTIISMASQGKGMLAMMSESVNTGGVVTVSLPDTLKDGSGSITHTGLFVECFFVGQNRAERLAQGYRLGAEMAAQMLGRTIVTERTSAFTGRQLKPQIDEIPADSPIYAIEPSVDFEAFTQETQRRFRRRPDISAIKSVREEANSAIVEAGFGFQTEADLSRTSYTRAHQVGRYALYEF
jgi:hypothetical protein